MAIRPGFDFIRPGTHALTRVFPHADNKRWIIPNRRPPSQLVGVENVVVWDADSVLQVTTQTIANAPDFTFSCWVRFDDPAPVGQFETIFAIGQTSGTGVGARFRRNNTAQAGTGRLELELRDATGATALNWLIDGSLFPRNVAHNITLNYAGINSLSGFAQTTQLFINGIEFFNPDVELYVDDIRWNRNLYAIGGAANSVLDAPLRGPMAQMYVTNTFVDLSGGGIEKFYINETEFVDLGVNGELPSGGKPSIFMGVPKLANTGGVDNNGWNGGSNQSDNNFDFDTLIGPGVVDFVG